MRDRRHYLFLRTAENQRLIYLPELQAVVVPAAPVIPRRLQYLVPEMQAVVVLLRLCQTQCLVPELRTARSQHPVIVALRWAH
jgi:hypothetical protein